jgi:hypothetical protein
MRFTIGDGVAVKNGIQSFISGMIVLLSDPCVSQPRSRYFPLCFKKQNIGLATAYFLRQLLPL